MLSHILAVIPTELPSGAVGTSSVSLAAAFNATLDVAAVGFEQTRMPLIAGGSVAMASAYEPKYQNALDRATAALSWVESTAARSNVACRCRPFCLQLESAAGTLCALARLHDLTVLAQPDDNLSAADSFLARKILFDSGGPVLFIPPKFEERLSMKRVGICWDGSRLAARALHDAMPLLSTAEMVGIINVEVDNAISTEASPSRLFQYLTEMKLPCQEFNLASDRSRIVPTILSLASDESIGLLVMGAYGHAPIIESVFGGVTFNMLRRMSIPTLMSH